jgi:hypothetical protein
MLSSDFPTCSSRKKPKRKYWFGNPYNNKDMKLGAANSSTITLVNVLQNGKDTLLDPFSRQLNSLPLSFGCISHGIESWHFRIN